MAKKKKRSTSKSSQKRLGVKHHAKLLAFLGSKILIAFLAFTIGIYFGSFSNSPIVVLLIAGLIALFIYMMSVLHLMDKMKM